MIIEARECESFNELSPQDKKIVIANIVAEASATTGCKPPSSDFALDTLIRLLVDFICKFGFGELTEKELSLAMLINSKGGNKHPSQLEIEQIQFTGQTFNIDYYSKVLENYTTMRKQLERKFENHIDGY